MTRFLVHGNAPTVKTGYGIQIAHLVEQLKADGHEPACSSTYGIQGGVETWNGIRVYGCGYDVNSNDRIHMHARHWFRDEPGWIITCIDVWAMQNPLLAEFNVAAWVPIDHFTSVGPQPNIREFFERTDAVPIAMSRFGESLLLRAGLDPVYIPLSVDTNDYKPTTILPNGMTPREIMGVPEDAFVVGMVAMNKGWARDRKGFNEAFWAFGMFDREYPDANAYLYIHADAPGGAEGINLRELAIHAGIQPHKIVFAGGPDQYGYYLTYTPEMMAGVYTAMDVLLAPSHGEGFCVPLIEAQACGTPVIATNFSAQTELVTDETGWLVEGQPEWDPAHHALYKCPIIADVVNGLEFAWKADRAAMAPACIEHAQQYDTAFVYETYWRPFIKDLEAQPERLPLKRDPMPEKDAVAVLVPLYKRTEHIEALADSFRATTKRGEARLVFLWEHGDDEVRDAVLRACGSGIDGISGQQAHLADGGTAHTYAEKLNEGLRVTTEPWVLCIGDDTRLRDGWLDAARKLSEEFDIIGTNDSLPGRTRNPKVARGVHADHFFVRRAYVEEYGASLEGPGILAPEVYGHWYTDEEIIRLARARGVFSPCLESIVEHLHPGYDGDAKAREADPTYMAAVEHSSTDEQTFRDRLPLIEMQRTTRGKP